jgi:hypothetical protein
MTKSFRSKDMSSLIESERPMKICFTHGSPAFAVGPSWALFVGTLRQPSTHWPSSRHGLLEHRLALAGAPGRPAAGRPCHAVLAGARQLQLLLLALAGEELVGLLEEDAGAVARVRLASAGAAVLEVDEHLDGLRDDVVRSPVLEIGHEADAARVVLVGRVIKSLLLRVHLPLPREASLAGGADVLCPAA